MTSIGAVINVGFIFYAISRYKLMVIDTLQIEAVSQVLFRNVSDGIILADINESIVQINETARKILPDKVDLKTIDDLKQFPIISRSDKFRFF